MISFKQFICEADLNSQLKSLGLKRTNKFGGIGKEMGSDIYLHRKYEHTLPQELLAAAKSKLTPDYGYTAVKYNPKTGTFSFIKSNDFDSNPEPSVNGGVTVKADGTSKPFGDAGWIWHHKWMWVADDYDGFDVEESKKRSLQWSSLQGISKARIGQRRYWEQNVLPLIKEEKEQDIFVLLSDKVGKEFDGSSVSIPAGTKLYIDRINTFRNGSVELVVYDRSVKISLQYDNKAEAEEDLGITL
jgi:hypothetical protein